MNVEIDNKEILLLLSGVLIYGSFNTIARNASFSFLYDENNAEFQNIKAKTGSKVVIKDNSKTVFKGRVTRVEYFPAEKRIQILAQDSLSLLLNRKLTGRFSGDILSVISQAIKELNLDGAVDFIKDAFSFEIKTLILQSYNTNILSFKTLSAYDIISAALYKYFKNNFKLYIDGNSKLKLFTPFLSTPKDELAFGSDIISSSFSCNEEENLCQIKAFGNLEIVSGKVITLNNSQKNGQFVVIEDVHEYKAVHTMTLLLKERSFL